METPVDLNLPGILDRYFKAQNAHDIDAMVACSRRMPPCAMRAARTSGRSDPRLEDGHKHQVPRYGDADRESNRG